MSIIDRRYVIGKMLFNPDTNTYTDLIDGQILAKKMSNETKTESIFKEIFKIELEASSLTIKEISRDDKILSYYLEQQKDGSKKGITLKKADFGKLKPIFQEISEK